MAITTKNPATNEDLHTYEHMTEQEVMGIVDTAHNEFLKWQALPLMERVMIIKNIATVLRKNKDKYAELMTKEMGKAIKDSYAEIEKSAWCAEVYAENAKEWSQEEVVEADGLKHRVAYKPLGVILAIMPWNFPLWQAARFFIPTLLAGNAALLKHASAVTGFALLIEEALHEAGVPKGLFRTLVADHATVGKVIEHNSVQGVSLTGSTAAGKRVGEHAGRLLKRVVLELGGSDAFIVRPDVDVKAVALEAARGRFQNNGQSCIAAKRLIVHESIAKDFAKELVAVVESQYTIGDPLDQNTVLGSLIDEKTVGEMQAFVDDAVAKGAKVETGGKRPEGMTGAYFEPTILSHCTRDMRCVKEEVFGPIGPILTFSTDEEALEIANDSEFGLGGSVWTEDLELGEKMARSIDTGTVFVNSITKSDPRMPFGGVKESGIGRELSRFGLIEFTNIQGVSVYSPKKSE